MNLQDTSTFSCGIQLEVLDVWPGKQQVVKQPSSETISGKLPGLVIMIVGVLTSRAVRRSGSFQLGILCEPQLDHAQ